MAEDSLYRAFFERAMDVLLIVAEGRGQILKANPAAARLLSLSPEGLIGRSFFRFFARPEEADSARRDLETQGYLHDRQVTLRRQDGREVACLLTATVWRDEDGRPAGFHVVLREATEQSRLERQARLQERLAAIGQLAAGISHDFNNILATIILNSELLLQAEELSAHDRQRVQTIFDQARQAASLTSQILDFGRRTVMERQPLDLRPFMKELVKFLSQVLPENIKVSLTMGEGRFVIVADPARLQQVFVNLAVNARDAMPEGGPLTFRLEARQVVAGREPFPGMPPGRWVHIEVADGGTGIPGEVLPHIFEPFFTTKQPGQGTGLGLAQVYGLVKQHEGYIDVETRLGEGTTFHLYFPAVSQEPRPVAPPAPPGARGRGQRVLVVEDDAGTRQGLGEALEHLGYRPLLAASGEEALRLLESDEPVDAVLTDLVMPGMGGIALYEEIQARWSRVPVVVMTGYPLADEMRARLEGQGLTWLQKPLTSSQLAQVLQEVLQTKR